MFSGYVCPECFEEFCSQAEVLRHFDDGHLAHSPPRMEEAAPPSTAAKVTQEEGGGVVSDLADDLADAVVAVESAVAETLDDVGTFVTALGLFSPDGAPRRSPPPPPRADFGEGRTWV